MSRFRFLAVLVFLPALAPAAVVAPLAAQEASVRAAARAYVAAACKNTPPSCEEAKNLLRDYEAALAAATDCDAGGCKLADIAPVAKTLGELDRREASLPFPPDGRRDRPFLALSSIASGRLIAAGTRLGQPYATAGYGAGAEIERQKAVEGACVDRPASCREMRALLISEAALTLQLDACAATTCALGHVDGLLEKGRIAMSDYLRLAADTKVNTLPVFSVVNIARNKGISLYTPLANQAAADLETGAAALGSQLDRAEKDASAPMDDIDASGRDLFEKQRGAALAADRLIYYLQYDPKTGAPARRERINAAEVRLAGLRSRALALRLARGLADDKGAVAGAPRGPGGSAHVKPGVVLSEPARTIIDRRLVPNLAPVSGSAPPISKEKPSAFQVILNLFSTDPLLKADAQRRLGRTKTVGDPGRYALSAFVQKDPSSCAVAAQAQVLHAHGLLPAGKTAASQERALIAEARARGYMDGGTPPEYSGSLLTERGMLLVKGHQRDSARFQSAVKRGSLIQVGVDATVIWGLTDTAIRPHSILVTGAELSKSDGSILGVYINDSGTDPPGAGKFISWDKLNKAWRGSYAEVR